MSLWFYFIFCFISIWSYSVLFIVPFSLELSLRSQFAMTISRLRQLVDRCMRSLFYSFICGLNTTIWKSFVYFIWNCVFNVRSHWVLVVTCLLLLKRPTPNTTWIERGFFFVVRFLSFLKIVVWTSLGHCLSVDAARFVIAIVHRVHRAHQGLDRVHIVSRLWCFIYIYI